MDAIYNWSNHLIPNTRGQIERIASRINTRLAEGFNMGEAVDLLIGEGEDLSTVQQVVNRMLDQEEHNETVISRTERKIPVKYADIKDDIASLVKTMKPEEFTSVFASRNSLMSLSEKKQDEFKELVWYAKHHPEDRELNEEVHSYVQPYIEQAIQDSQALAKEAEDNSLFKFKKTAENIYRIKDGNDTYQVDIMNRTCTCPRYILCGFNLLGLTCEHILTASRKFDEKFTEDMVGSKTIFAHNYGNNIRYAWCSRANNEIVIEKSCIEANCPFMQKDEGETIICNFC